MLDVARRQTAIPRTPTGVVHSPPVSLLETTQQLGEFFVPVCPTHADMSRYYGVAPGATLYVYKVIGSDVRCLVFQ